MRPIFTIATALGLCVSTSALAQQDFLQDGGGITTGYDIGLDTDDDFLAGGGSISDEDSVTFTSKDEEFLEDGGSVSAGAQVFTPEREEFLEDGGGITSEITVPTEDVVRYTGIAGQSPSSARFVGKPAKRAWRYVETPGVSTSGGVGSVLYVSIRPGVYENRAERARLRDARAGRYANPGPKVINIEEARLDKRPYPKSGVDVIVTGGGSKIIRIAPGY
ncbi:hypothetical protein [Fulvimarina sp. MAC3]|uniref:hypothetical protein n=1 Tax=Fulvimarina sp. MAC3 TaxID=3148887 RepID=UPI0031FDEEA1